MALTKVSRGLLSTSIVDNGNATAITIDSSENVGIGTSPSTKVDIKQSTDNAFSGVRIERSTTSAQYSVLSSAQGTTYLVGVDTNDAGNNVLSFGNSGNGSTYNEAMRIDSSGNLLVGTTSSHGKLAIGDFSATGADYGVAFVNGGDIYFVRSSTNTSANNAHYQFYNTNGNVGSITTNGSATAYNTSSDYRLKENVVAMTGATERLKQLNPSRFNFIADPDSTVDGFLAHEVADVVPEAITGTHNEVDDDGNHVYQGIDQSKLVPLLVATIQELEARITQLENN